jgi:hypothetical protein
LAEETEVLGENLPQFYSVLGSNSDHSDLKPATNHLICDMDVKIMIMMVIIIIIGAPIGLSRSLLKY